MAIYHLSVKTISRSAGRSATAASAYRCGVKIADARTGEEHDYTKRRGVDATMLVLPEAAPQWASDRAALWNAAEAAERRKNSTVAREFEIALPAELSAKERARLARDFARELVQVHGCAADVAIHAPGKGGDQRNHHAHILLTTRRLGADGLGEKTRELDDKRQGAEWVTKWRERFAVLQNERLVEAKVAARVDHRSLAEQGIEREPGRHLGPAATGFERRTGCESFRRRFDSARKPSEAAQMARRAALLAQEGDSQAQEVQRLSGAVLAARQAQKSAESPKPAGIESLMGGGGLFHPSVAAFTHRSMIRDAQAKREAEAKAQRAAEAAARAEQSRQAEEAAQEARRQAEARQKAEEAERQARAERERLDAMSSWEVGQEIERLRPESVDALVARDPAVKWAREAREALEAQLRQAREKEAAAKREAEAWRQAHPMRAKAHDSGMFRSAVLDEQAGIEAQAWQARAGLAPKIETAKYREQIERRRAGERISEAQAPVLAQVAELEALRAQKERQEAHEAQMQRERERAEQEAARQAKREQAKAAEREKVVREFVQFASLRESGHPDYRDGGEQWEAAPVPLQRFVDRFNQGSAREREAAVQKLQRSPEVVDTLGHALKEREYRLDQDRDQDYGLSL